MLFIDAFYVNGRIESIIEEDVGERRGRVAVRLSWIVQRVLKWVCISN